ncbi:dynein light chain Tctex-type protein 2B isoform X2 [Eurosta solidaginis]|uniref:dynein light chain Tctex-type protein 2B isoform X2 n=1 Tax=Eurosta solidaginis TaxID=178769 RepID=UPI0035306048
MATWTGVRTRITASVRTTNRMNALLMESMLGKKRALQKLNSSGGEDEVAENAVENPERDWEFFRNNFSMEAVYKLIAKAIEERLTWDRFGRSYDSWRSLQMAATLAADIRDRVKRLQHKRHRIVCFLSIIERNNQGLSFRMRHLMDEKMDNFTNLVYERPSYYMVVTLFLVYKE